MSRRARGADRSPTPNPAGSTPAAGATPRSDEEYEGGPSLFMGIGSVGNVLDRDDDEPRIYLPNGTSIAVSPVRRIGFGR